MLDFPVHKLVHSKIACEMADQKIGALHRGPASNQVSIRRFMLHDVMGLLRESLGDGFHRAKPSRDNYWLVV